jgi:phosphoenolpyruvate-protein phosphotransferase
VEAFIVGNSEQMELRGIPAAPGLAAGIAFLLGEKQVHFSRETGRDPKREWERLDAARAKALVDLQQLKEKVEREIGPEEAAIFDAHGMLLEDITLTKRVRETIDGGINAEAAWMDGIDHFAQQLENLPDPTLSARAADLRDIGQRVVLYLLGESPESQEILPEDSVVIARDLSPSQTASLEKDHVAAFCIAEGAPTSHAAILAKALGVPAIVGVGEELLKISKGIPLLVDGGEGLLIAHPSEGTRDAFEQKLVHVQALSEAERATAHLPAVTKDHHQVEVVANVGGVEDAVVALEMGAEGIGLLRTEFLYLKRNQAPNEDEQVEVYREILEVMGSRPVVARTIDVGGDKDMPYLDIGKEANPFLGWRGLRFCLGEPKFFKQQLRALLRAGVGHDLRVMLPMVATLAEVRQAKQLITEARHEIESDGGEVADPLQIGMMVETPAAAVQADLFAPEVDFFSIGTNDLTQYTMAAERTNPKVAYLGDPCHPAILRLIQQVIDAGHKAGIWVGVCGEMAGDPDAIPILLGFKLDEFSMSPYAIPHAKELLRTWTLSDAKALAGACLNLDSSEAVRALVNERAQTLLAGS